jgi:uncharacterized membrane protein YhaH (DUF805 family)
VLRDPVLDLRAALLLFALLAAVLLFALLAALAALALFALLAALVVGVGFLIWQGVALGDPAENRYGPAPTPAL